MLILACFYGKLGFTRCDPPISAVFKASSVGDAPSGAKLRCCSVRGSPFEPLRRVHVTPTTQPQCDLYPCGPCPLAFILADPPPAVSPAIALNGVRCLRHDAGALRPRGRPTGGFQTAAKPARAGGCSRSPVWLGDVLSASQALDGGALNSLSPL